MTNQSRNETLYDGTNIELVPFGGVLGETVEYGVAVVDSVEGHRFAWYVDCGVVHVEERAPKPAAPEVAA